MTSNQVSLILAFKKTFRVTFRMTFRITFRMTSKTWDFRGVFKKDSEGNFKGYFKGSSRGCLRGTWRGTWRGLAVKLRSGPGVSYTHLVALILRQTLPSLKGHNSAPWSPVDQNSFPMAKPLPELGDRHWKCSKSPFLARVKKVQSSHKKMENA